ncbi:fructose-bisphosphatase class III [Enterococcus faecalis]|uniref:fructose-1,6-bisphosphatase n=1 Tax=Enterococcus faecalis TaxID=1351 RepID=UPI001C023A09|nr:fructose-1,6-bisphosphatase [Enterococcus faecalis]MBT9730116.1 fructose-bisphosphatase class III [Enterococcus faecalis]
MATLNRDQQIEEIINLEAILNLPKGTEHFVSDLHGEFEAFDHILRNGSGRIREKVQFLFKQELNAHQMDELCFIIYYPEEKLTLLENESALSYEWWLLTIRRLVEIVRSSSMKYTRSKVRKALPETYGYILEELIYQYDETTTKNGYYQQIIEKIILLGEAKRFVTELAYLIQRLIIDHLHVIGDIYDRGPAPDKIMDRLMSYHSLDIQLGNHDMIWLAAYSGSLACLANVVRICARYGNLDLLEERYAIDLTALKKFSLETYKENPAFEPKKNPYRALTEDEKQVAMRVQQAIAIIQEKLEGQIIGRRPDFNLAHRLRLDKIQGETITFDECRYTLINSCFQTVSEEQPYQLTREEKQIIDDLLTQFQSSPRLTKHMRFLMEKASLYLVYNQNLLIHGCLPLNADGTFQAYTFKGHSYSGKALVDFFQEMLEEAYAQPASTDDYATDCLWYLWCGEGSSLFGKRAMKTFERYFLAEKETHYEEKNPYYSLRDTVEVCESILDEFEVTGENRHIINGHTPVKRTKGESPIKANGTLLVIDGGFSKSYQTITGIAGYTLLYNSFGLQLTAHKSFSSKETAILNNQDIHSIKQVIDRPLQRLLVKDTTIGKELLKQSQALQKQMKQNQ